MALSLTIPAGDDNFWTSKPKVDTQHTGASNSYTPGVFNPKPRGKPLVETDLTDKSIGIKVNPSNNVSVFSGVDFDALLAFANRQKDNIARTDKATIKSNDNGLGASVQRSVDGNRKDLGLAAYVNKGGFNVSGGTYKSTYDGHTTGEGQHAKVGYDNDLFGLAGSFNKHVSPYGKNTSKALQGRYSPEFGGNITLDLKQHNNNRPSAELGYNIKF